MTCIELYCIDNDGWTCLHLAAYGGDVSTLDILLKYLFSESSSPAAKKLINFKSHKGNTPLLIACVNKHPEVVEMLLAHGADVTITSTLRISSLLPRHPIFMSYL